MKKLSAIFIGLCVGAAILSARAQTTNTNHTVVRFDVLAGGTNFGSLDLELFDQEKPATVRNFLLYLNSGNYSNLVIHRLATNFVLQGGQVHLANPRKTNDLATYTGTRYYGPITNEFSTGPALSNVFGTIAAARVGGQTNSASTDWFINLKDNPELDVIDGGYTVFGRVINTTAANTGTNLLQSLGSYTNVVKSFFDQYSSALPVTDTNHLAYTTNYVTNYIFGVIIWSIDTNVVATPRVSEIFTIQPSVLQGAIPFEKKAPTVRMTGNRPHALVITNATLPFEGTSSDNREVERVLYTVTPRGGITRRTTPNWQNAELAAGTTNWSADVTLEPGTNIVFMKSIDRFGNESRVVRQTVFYRVPTPIYLTNDGAGTIVGATNLQALDIGRNYSLSVRVAPRHFFAGWYGSFQPFPYPRITFTMEPNFQAIARFPTNYLLGMRGAYYGLIIPSGRNGGQHATGTITVNVAPSGDYNGQLKLLTGTYPIRGKFDLFTRSSVIGGMRGISHLTLALGLETNEVRRISGYYSDGAELGSVVLHHVEAATTNMPQAGHYPFSLRPLTNSQAGDGFGVGTFDITDTGAVSLGGMLQDGTHFSTISASGYSGRSWPVNTKLSTGGMLMGWMDWHSTTNGDGFTGALQWIKPSFTNKSESCLAEATRYVPPAEGANPLDLTNAVVTFSGGGLTSSAPVNVTFQAGTVTVESNAPTQVELSVELDTGIVTGNFVHPVTGTNTPFEAVLLKTNGAGFFLAPGRSGAVTISGR